jgi:hypothetical protein
MASPNWSEIATTTLYNRSGKLADNVTKNLALLYRLSERGNVKPVSGGRSIIQELEYAENGTYTRYAGYDTVSIAPSDVLSAAEYDWKQAAVAVSMSGLEELQNSGPDAVIDLLESRIKNAERTMMNSIYVDMYSDGTASGGKQIGGLQLLVADSPTTGTIGGINRATWTFWRNITVTTTFTAAAIQTGLNSAFAQTSRGRDQIDLWLADNTAWLAYLGSLQAIQRITNDKLGQAGFQNLKFMGGDFVLDGGYGGAAPSSHVYGLNTNYIFYRPHRDRNMVPLNPTRFSTNQDAFVKLIGFAGNMTLSNGFLQAVCHT